jgi:hypothetical protein
MWVLHESLILLLRAANIDPTLAVTWPVVLLGHGDGVPS